MSMIAPVRYLSNKVIEKHALKLLADFQRSAGIQLRCPPIPIARIVEAHLDLSILYEDIPQDEGERILAYIDPEKRQICLNTRHLKLFNSVIGPEAFTLAHEVGHWELHIIRDGWKQLELPIEAGASQAGYLCRANSSDPREIQANRFAAELLMPAYLITDAVRTYPPVDWEAIQLLAEQFAVSVTAMRIRLENLEIIRVEGTRIHLSGFRTRLL